MEEVRHGLADSSQQQVSHPTHQTDFHSTAAQRQGARRALAAIDAAKQTSDPKVASKVVSRLLDRCISEQSLPSLVTRFMETHLRSHLLRLCIAEGEEGPNWSRACQFTDKLVWSVQPKWDKESRKQLFPLIPELFQWIHALLRSQQVPAREEDAFFAEISKLHAAALHPPEDPAAVSPSEGSSEQTVADPGSEDRSLDIARTENVASEKSGIDSAPDQGNTGSDRLLSIRIGAWLEFTNERATKRAMRLKWKSSQGSVFLFQDHHSEDTLYLTAARLDQRLRDGSVCVLI